MKIGFIGIGNMGGALAKAVAQVPATELLLSNHNPAKAQVLAQELGASLASNEDIATQADVIFLGVKPYLMADLISQLAVLAKPETIWISMAAGITLTSLSQYLPTEYLVRIMPNTPVAIGEGMTTYSVVNSDLAPVVETLLASSGQLMQVSENLMDAATALAGCGPAFVYQMIEALTDAGIEQGIQASDAKRLVAQTLLGAAQMVLGSEKHPAQLRQEVTSPGGSTIAGVVSLEKSGFRSALMQAVSAAAQRTQELGK
ncbi:MULTISPECIES: pyrroline-5-carboxylate reductase [unclassified Streptococcus]|uniref:pyrroline-5-carboxylate reductase n=1 Tax=unclassified Streptococcus TaxID=2608887 RepID=UPI00107262B7|nr:MULTISPECIES: pyrroline-5-carboxylate reductase [unclassified Streptococcus]MBF0806084.1 pyrroline-5-carboxylate reductase [Streptococcus sp. 19428wA2_WM07]TFU28331.1 pyrroline-5-carboxylate reductase [Streptococcus sp. WM07]